MRTSGKLANCQLAPASMCDTSGCKSKANDAGTSTFARSNVMERLFPCATERMAAALLFTKSRVFEILGILIDQELLVVRRRFFSGSRPILILKTGQDKNAMKKIKRRLMNEEQIEKKFDLRIVVERLGRERTAGVLVFDKSCVIKLFDQLIKHATLVLGGRFFSRSKSIFILKTGKV